MSCLASAAAEPQIESVQAEQTPSFSSAVSVYYSRSTAPESVSDFSHSYGTSLALGFAPIPRSTLRVRGSFDQTLEVREQKFRAANTEISWALPSYSLTPSLDLLPGVLLLLPTNEEDRTYLSYRGTLGSSLAIRKNFSGASARWLRPLSLSLGFSVNRSTFTYEANRAGGLNRYWTAALFGGLGYQFSSKLSLSANLRNSRAWFSNGSRDNDRYAASFGAYYALTEKLSLAIEEVTSDRTFGYDAVSNNVSLYDSRLAYVVGSATYSF